MIQLPARWQYITVHSGSMPQRAQSLRILRLTSCAGNTRNYSKGASDIEGFQTFSLCHVSGSCACCPSQIGVHGRNGGASCPYPDPCHVTSLCAPALRIFCPCHGPCLCPCPGLFSPSCPSSHACGPPHQLCRLYLLLPSAALERHTCKPATQLQAVQHSRTYSTQKPVSLNPGKLLLSRGIRAEIR